MDSKPESKIALKLGQKIIECKVFFFIMLQTLLLYSSYIKRGNLTHPWTHKFKGDIFLSLSVWLLYPFYPIFIVYNL